ncbi:hypothetical protein [Paenibacillus sp. D9]|uniref:hypothetical protein n=1 Tax=Paenibacillus sp. D9 TaxID=665792 RepID=UPI000A62CE97|nr:hypothetical protein [Paenibacillus sp. D9]
MKLTPDEYNARLNQRKKTLLAVYRTHERGQRIKSVDLSGLSGPGYLDYIWLIDNGYLTLLRQSTAELELKITGKGINEIENNYVEK